jgi:hypothetical protein
MIKRAASYIRYVDSSGELLASKDITSTDITNFLNDRYLEDVFPKFADLRPEYFARISTAPNYAATGTVSASSTSTILIAGSSIFTNGMVDAFVYNTTDGDSRYITGYTSGTTVTVDSSIGDTWDGDTIYVYTGTFSFGSDSTDIYRPDWVGVKYNSTDKDYTRAEIMNGRDIFELSRGRESKNVISALTPVYEFDTVTISSVPTSAIRIYPYNWDTAISDGIFIKYIEKPAALSAVTDSPRLPLGHHKFLVYGAVADALSKLDKFQEASVYEGRYQQGRAELMRMHPAERQTRTINFGRRTYKFKLRG